MSGMPLGEESYGTECEAGKPKGVGRLERVKPIFL
jgi:hypothetical protein